MTTKEYPLVPHIDPQWQEIRKQVEQDRLLVSAETLSHYNVWDSIDDFNEVLRLMRIEHWFWIDNPICKYVELRVDMRTGKCIIKNRDGERITVSQLRGKWIGPIEQRDAERADNAEKA